MSTFYIARVAPASEDWREAITQGVEVLDRGHVWKESFAPDAFIKTEQPAPVLLDHEDRKVVGRVVSPLTAHGGWHYLTFELDRSQNLSCVALDRIEAGTPVSIGFHPISHDKLLAESGITKRHTVARLDELSILAPNDHPSYPGAKVTQVLKPSAKRAPVARRPVAAAAPVIRRAVPIYREDEELVELHRRLDWHEARGSGVSLEEVLGAMQRELRTLGAGGQLRLVG